MAGDTFLDRLSSYQLQKVILQQEISADMTSENVYVE
jgi:hypothetical protein